MKIETPYTPNALPLRDPHLVRQARGYGQVSDNLHQHSQSSGQADRVDLGGDLTPQKGQEILFDEILRALSEFWPGFPTEWAGGNDSTPTGLLKRLLEMLDGVFPSWRARQTEMTEAAAATVFEKRVRQQVEQGLTRALSVLEGLGADTEVLSLARTTRELLLRKFDERLAALRQWAKEGHLEAGPELTTPVQRIAGEEPRAGAASPLKIFGTEGLWAWLFGLNPSRKKRERKPERLRRLPYRFKRRNPRRRFVEVYG